MYGMTLIVFFKLDYPSDGSPLVAKSYTIEDDDDTYAQISFVMAIMSNIASISKLPEITIDHISINSNNPEVYEKLKLYYKDRYVVTSAT